MYVGKWSNVITAHLLYLTKYDIILCYQCVDIVTVVFTMTGSTVVFSQALLTAASYSIVCSSNAA